MIAVIGCAAWAIAIIGGMVALGLWLERDYQRREFWEKFTGRAFTEIDDLTAALDNLEFKVSEYEWELAEPSYPLTPDYIADREAFIVAREADMAEIVRRLVLAHVAVMADEVEIVNVTNSTTGGN
jgi:hypothetical protein